jgi:hypothetical protein
MDASNPCGIKQGRAIIYLDSSAINSKLDHGSSCHFALRCQQTISMVNFGSRFGAAATD